MSKEKYYQIGTHTSEQCQQLNQELQQENIGIISRCVNCSDGKNHSPTRGTYLLTDQEAEELKLDPRIKFIQTDPEHYKEEYHIPEDELKMEIPVDRYQTPVKNYHFWATSFSVRGDFDTGATSLNRASSQLLRLQQRSNPWLPSGSSQTVIEEIPKQKFTGKDVDVICADNGTWIGHTEFINSGVQNAVNPENYIGGNPLPGNGYCDVLDVVLDGPYYLDPAWFSADPDNRLETRWDGTIVPTENEAFRWWNDPTNRSIGFDFGSITIDIAYTRDRQHGSNTSFPTFASANHGTQCASLIYGRTHGWAYNANKWHLNLYGSGSNPISTGFDIQKIFHEYKPVNTLYGNKNPTISSNSWGFRANKSGNFYYWREDVPVAYGGTDDEPEFIRYMGIDGDIGRWSSEHGTHSETVAGDEMIDAGVIFLASAGNSGQQQVSPDHPNFDNFISFSDTADVDDFSYSELSRPTKGTTNRRGFPNHIGQTENYEYPAIAIGALDDIFGTYDNVTKERKVNYSNMGNSIDIYAPADGTLAATVDEYGLSVSRFDDTYADLLLESNDESFSFTGSPSIDTTETIIGTEGSQISIIFFEEGFEIRNDTESELFSIRGNFTGTGQAFTQNGVESIAFDTFIDADILQAGEATFFPYESVSGGSVSLLSIDIAGLDLTSSFPAQGQCFDTRFSGTSAACPVACGLISTWLEKNRTWTYRDIRNYIQRDIQVQDDQEFHIGPEASEPNGSEWADRTNIQSTLARVVYEGSTTLSPPRSRNQLSKTGSFTFKGGMSVGFKK